MKDYFKYIITFKSGDMITEFSEFLITEQGKYTDLQAHDICFTRALLEIGERELISFEFERSNELDYRKDEKERIKNKEAKTTLERAIHRSH